jgi:hypothetical protein
MALTINNYEIQNILNMACLKATGFYLPDLGEDNNNWKYKIVNGKKVGFLPKLNPRTIISFSIDNSIPKQICRSIIVGVFKEAKKYALSGNDLIRRWNRLVVTEKDWFEAYAHYVGDRDKKIEVKPKKLTDRITDGDIHNLGYWNGMSNKFNYNIRYFCEAYYKECKKEVTPPPTDWNKVKRTLRYDYDIMGEDINTIVNSMNPMKYRSYKVKPAQNLVGNPCDYDGFSYFTTGGIQEVLMDGGYCESGVYIRSDKGRSIRYRTEIKLTENQIKTYYTKKKKFRKRENGSQYLRTLLIKRAIKLSNGAYDSHNSYRENNRYDGNLFTLPQPNCYYEANTHNGSFRNSWWRQYTFLMDIKPTQIEGWDYISSDDLEKPDYNDCIRHFKTAIYRGGKYFVADIDYQEQMRIFGVKVEPNVESKLIKYYG